MKIINHIPLAKTPKQACLYLGGFVALCSVMIVQLNLRKTYGLYASCKSYEQDISRSATALDDIARYTSLLGNGIGEEQRGYDRARLLEVISDKSETGNVYVESFPQASYTDVEGYPIVTSTLHLTGSYTDIIDLIYQIEHVHQLSTLAGIEMKTIKNRKTKKNQLHAHITLRNVNHQKDQGI